MTKQLLNLHTITKIPLILTTLLLPSVAMAEDTYTYGSGISLRYNDDFNQYSQALDYIWKVSMTGTNPSSNSDGFTNFDELKLTFQEPLKGELSDVALTSVINNNYHVDIKVYKLTAPEADTRTQIGTIEIKEGETTTYEYHTLNNENLYFDNEYIQISFEKKDPNYETSISTGAIEGIVLKFKGKDYGLNVGGYKVTSNNASDILGDGRVLFEGEKSTLTLNQANLTKGIRTTIDGLKIDLIGESTITSSDSAAIKSWTETNELSLTFCSTDGTGNLVLTPQNGSMAIDGFSVSFENNLVAVGNLKSSGESITIEKGYDIWIENQRFSPSKRDGGVSGDISYDDNTHTLSLGGIFYSVKIKSCLPELIVKIKNSNSIQSITFDNQGDESKIGSIVFEKDGTTSEFYKLIFNSDLSGFKNISFRDGLGKREESGIETTSYIIEPMTAPRIFSDGGFGISSDEGFEGEIIYSVDYYGTENDITNATYEETLEMKPCTITAFIRNSDNNTSPSITAKYFGFAESVMSVPYQASVDIPNIFPELPDGVTVSYSASETSTAGNTIDNEKKTINISGITKEKPDGYSAEFSAPTDADFTILNEPASFSTGGPATSYSIEPFFLTVTQKSLADVTIEDITDQPFTGAAITPEVVIKNGEFDVTSDDCVITYSDNTNVGTATVTVTPTEISRYSGSATKTFNITPLSIADATVTLENGNEFTYSGAKCVPTIGSVTLTIGTSTPEVTAPSIPLTAGTDYDISYIKGGEAIDADNIINAGEYKMVLTGKGNFTGTKSVSFTITQATISAVTLEKTQLSWTGEEQTVGVSAVKAGDVDVPSTDYTISGNKGKEPGTYTVNVTAKEGGNFKGSATAQFSIDGGYMLWVGNTLVTPANKDDVLGDNGTGEGDEKRLAPSFVFNPDENTLLIIKSEASLTIESRLPELKIHITGNNKLKAITFNNQGNSENTGTLMFTCDSNEPGRLEIKNNEGKKSITGFKSVTFDETSNLCILDGAITEDSIVIGTPMKPITDNGDGTLNPDDFTTTNPDGTTKTADLTNTNINDILYTLPETTEGQGYNPEDNSISIVTPMSDNEVEKIIAAAKEQTVTVGSSDYAAQYLGITFLIPGGKGDIIIDQEAVEGYEFHLKIGDDEPITLGEGTAGRLKVTIEYEVPDATYCWLYLVQKTAGVRGWGNTRVGKRDHAHGHIHSVSIKAKSVSSSNSASKASGGTISVETNAAITGIEEVKTDTERAEQGTDKTDERWYTMDGRRIDKPTQKGLYIRNRKKVVIK